LNFKQEPVPETGNQRLGNLGLELKNQKLETRN
jgi:hypothetical protein